MTGGPVASQINATVVGKARVRCELEQSLGEAERVTCTHVKHTLASETKAGR